MKYDFYDDMSMFNNFMPYDVEKLNNMPSNFQASTNKMIESNNNFEGMSSNNMKNNFSMNNNFDYEMLDDVNMNNHSDINMSDYSNINMNKQSNANNLNLFSPYEGYIHGNGFKDQYVPYKNYQPARLNITSEKDEMMINIGQYSFMAHELNLWLDTHPEDREALRKFQEFRDKANDLVKTYERKYGPLSVSGNVSNQTPFNWVTTSWPWVK